MDEMEKLLAEQKRLEEELLDDKSDGSAPGTEEGVRLLEVSMEDLDPASKLVDTLTTVDKLIVSSSGGLNLSASSSGGQIEPTRSASSSGGPCAATSPGGLPPAPTAEGPAGQVPTGGLASGSTSSRAPPRPPNPVQEGVYSAVAKFRKDATVEVLPSFFLVAAG